MPDHGGPERQRLLTREFLTLGAAASVYFLATGAFNAILPRFVVDDLNGTEATAGFVMGSMAFSALLTRMWWGRLADRRGARRILGVGAVITTAAFLVILAWPTLAGAIAGRLLVGAGGAAFMTGASLLSIDLAPANRRSEAVSYILVAFHIGLGLGPLSVEKLVGAEASSTLWLTLAAVTAAAGAFTLLLPHRPGDPAAEPGPLIHPAGIGPGVVALFGVAAFNGFMTFAPLYAREVGLNSVGIVFIVASMTIVASRLLLSRVPDLIGPVRAGTGALIVTIGAATLVALWATPTGMLVGAALLAVGLSLQSPSFMSLAVEGVDASERGSSMATFTASFDVATAVIGPTIGLIVSGVGYRPAFLASGLMSLIAIAILNLVVAPQRRAALAVAP